MNKHSAMNKQIVKNNKNKNKNRTLSERELFTVFTTKKQKQCLKVKRCRSTVQNGASIQEVKISTVLYSINHCQNENFSKNSSNFFGL